MARTTGSGEKAAFGSDRGNIQGLLGIGVGERETTTKKRTATRRLCHSTSARIYSLPTSASTHGARRSKGVRWYSRTQAPTWNTGITSTTWPAMAIPARNQRRRGDPVACSQRCHQTSLLTWKWLRRLHSRALTAQQHRRQPPPRLSRQRLPPHFSRPQRQP